MYFSEAAERAKDPLGKRNRAPREFCGSIRMRLLDSKCMFSWRVMFVLITLIHDSSVHMCSGPTTVLACSLMFIGLVVVLHIVGKFSS
jgi:hypothetical protein